MQNVTAFVKLYAGFGAIGLCVLALYTGLISQNFVLPSSLFLGAAVLAIFRFRDDLRHIHIWKVQEWIWVRWNAFSVPAWLPPNQAAELCCAPDIVKSRNDASAEMNNIMMELVRAPNHERDNGQSEPTQLHLVYEAAQKRFASTTMTLSQELLKNLGEGKLIAKGLLMKGEEVRAERLISPSQWRSLVLDASKNTASGEGRNYSGLLIGKLNTRSAMKQNVQIQ